MDWDLIVESTYILCVDREHDSRVRGSKMPKSEKNKWFSLIRSKNATSN